jgi:hypothetical protein
MLVRARLVPRRPAHKHVRSQKRVTRCSRASRCEYNIAVQVLQVCMQCVLAFETQLNCEQVEEVKILWPTAGFIGGPDGDLSPALVSWILEHACTYQWHL